MGIYDREYYRRPTEATAPIWPRTAVVNIILICVGLYLIDWLFFSEDHTLTAALAVTEATLLIPWLWWKFLTYGFVHAPQPGHIILNMLQLFFLGREVEERYGTREFWLLYLAMIVVGGLAHAIVNFGTHFILIGASGAVNGVVLLFVLNNPHATLTLFPIPIPIPAWFLGLALVVMNTLGALSELGLIAGGEGSGIAFVVHLTGLAFAYLYFRFRWNLSGLLTRFHGGFFKFSRRPRLRVVDEADEETDNLDAEIDRILEKISRYGEASLSRRERKILMNAAERYRSKLKKEESKE
ncbi:MAG: rhomboid family intramembrane serine protease [Thermoguttaceae bacterium]|nr:rhomboid family intramembrane serine protease [Thermoguttaceae bacterium]MDW8078025.1 rhomboid family intramembrane serine protease [Thermoguttaceae bacterium]